jgi:hypothetical protein
MVSNLALFYLATFWPLFKKNWAIFSKSSGHPDSNSHLNFKFKVNIKFIAVANI